MTHCCASAQAFRSSTHLALYRRIHVCSPLHQAQAHRGPPRIWVDRAWRQARQLRTGNITCPSRNLHFFEASAFRTTSESKKWPYVAADRSKSGLHGKCSTTLQLTTRTYSGSKSEVLKEIGSLEELLAFCRQEASSRLNAARLGHMYHRIKELSKSCDTTSEKWSQECDVMLSLLAPWTLKLKKDLLPQHISMVLGAYCALRRKPEAAVLDALKSEIYKRADGFEPRHVSGVLWAFAKLEEQPDKALFGKLCDRAGALTRLFNSQEVANVLWALATLGKHPGDVLFAKLCSQANNLMGSFTSQGVSNVIWACATLGQYPGDALFAKLCDRGCDVIGTFNSQGVSNVLWGCATLGRHPGDAFLGKLCNQASKVIGSFKSQEVANVLWACATLGEHPGDALFAKLCHQSCVVIGSFNSQGISNVLWACATLGQHPGDALFAKLCNQARKGIGSFNSQAISNVFWGCATLGRHPGDELFAKLCDQGCHVNVSFTSQGIVNLLWACATLGKHPGDALFAKLVGQASDLIDSFKSQEVANVLWACATLGQHPGDALFAKLCNQGLDIIGTFNSREVANLLWAMACLQQVKHGLSVMYCYSHNLVSQSQGTLHPILGIKDLRQIHQFLLSVDLEGPSTESQALLAYTTDVRQAMSGPCKQAFTSEEETPSELQKDIAAILKGLGQICQEEFVDARSGYSIDVLVGDNIAVEVDGPCHFLRDGRTATGATRMKRRHLQQLGYTAVCVPYWEWNNLSGRESKEEYLRRLLDIEGKSS